MRKAAVAIFANRSHPVHKCILEQGVNDLMSYKFIESVEHYKSGKFDAAYVVDLKDMQLSDFMKCQPSLKWIHTTMSGVDTILNEELMKSPIHLTNSKGCYNQSLTEFALYSILYFSKKMPEHELLRSRHLWEKQVVFNASRTKVTIIGYGSIGSTLAELLKNTLNCNIEGYTIDPYLLSQHQISFLDKLYVDTSFSLKESQFVVGILPKTKNTVGYFNKSIFQNMSKDSVFINIGRGATLHEESLIEALDKHSIKGAALDVYPVEPVLPSSKLWNYPNLLMSYHDMDHSVAMWPNSVSGFKEELLNFVNRRPFNKIVNKQIGY